jgi:hypothetical protein
MIQKRQCAQKIPITKVPPDELLTHQDKEKIPLYIFEQIKFMIAPVDLT